MDQIVEEKNPQERFQFPDEININKLQDEERKARFRGVRRLIRYSLLKLISLFITVVVGVYISVLVANMGGYVDEIRRSQIRETTVVEVNLDIEFQKLPEEERKQILEERIAIQERRYGLDRPFIIRSFSYLSNAITLNLGFSEGMTSDSGSRLVRNIILER